jgi:aldose 1-epimerase
MQRTISSPHFIPLTAGPYTATIAPQAGGKIASLKFEARGELVDLVVPWRGNSFLEHSWPKAGVFPLLPFVIRTRPEGFWFREQLYKPEYGLDGVPIHGHAHRRA